MLVILRVLLPQAMIHHLHTVDAHTAGEPLRMILGGFPEPRGESMLDKRAWLKRHADRLRRALMLEPRGHQDMYGALLTRPVRPDSDAGVLFMHNEGYSTMCGHGVIAIGTLVFERGLLTTREPNVVVLDASATSRRRCSRSTRQSRLSARPEHAGCRSRNCTSTTAPATWRWRTARSSPRSASRRSPMARAPAIARRGRAARSIFRSPASPRAWN